jgi:SpoVK/Ycf46/Vps4 family AAA+-type ATPase
MLDNFKRLKKISDMKRGEEGFLQVGGLIIDEQGRHWLNLDGKISTKGGGVLSPVIKKFGDDPSDVDVDFVNAYTPFMVNSEKLISSEGYVCLDHIEEENYSIKQDMDVLESVKEKLLPLYDIFLDHEVLNQVLINTGVPEIIRDEKPIFTGVILYGEGGTGKTSLQKAIAQVYKNCGAISEELNVAAMSEKYIGSLGNNLDKKIAEINKESEKLDKPAFIYLDEATSLVMSKESHNTSGADYYQEAVDVLKKYISNYPNLIFSITTNAMPDVYDDTLIREGRLTPILIPLPGKNEKIKMWEFFLKKHGIFEGLEYDEYEKLADLTDEAKGSFISEFARGYLPGKKLEEETINAGSKSILDALVKGSSVNLESLKKRLTFNEVLSDLKKQIQKSTKRNNKKLALGFTR